MDLEQHLNVPIRLYRTEGQLWHRRNMGDQLAQQAFAGLDIPALQQGLADALNGLEFAVSRDDINDASR